MTEPDLEEPLDALRQGSERASLEGFLDWYREAVQRKATGCSESDARRRLGSSETTVGGIVKHLRWVEMNWFQLMLAQVDPAELPPVPWTDADPDADFRMTEDETVTDLLKAYAAECARSRTAAAAMSLDQASPGRGGPTSLRWVYIHMIEETARHVGHLDILRELLDGTTGE